MRKVLTLNLTLKLLAGISQLSGLIFITKQYGIDIVGGYSIALLTILVAVQISGLGLNAHIVRILPLMNNEKKSEIFSKHLTCIVLSTHVVIALLFLTNHFSLISITNISIICVLIFTGTFNAQLENFLNASEKQTDAAINVLLRATWPMLLVLYSKYNTEDSLFLILIAIMSSEILSIIVSIYKIKHFSLVQTIIFTYDRSFIRSGFATGWKISLVGVLLLTTISTNRFLLEKIVDLESVGIYHIYFSMAMFVPGILESAYTSTKLPNFIREESTGNFDKKQFNYDILIISAICFINSLLIYLLFDIINKLISKPEILEYKYLSLIFGIYSSIFLAMRMHHYILYIKERDYALIIVNASILIVAVAAGYHLTIQFGIIGAAVSAVLSCTYGLIAHAIILNSRR